MADITKKYTQEDFMDMVLRAGAIKDYAETLTYADGRAKNQPPLMSIALIIIDFLSWAYTYAEIPEEEPEQTA